MFDLNNLKLANDTMGHSADDQLIANFARILRNVIPAKSTDYKECILRTLFDKADHYMYENKQKAKAGRR